MNTCRLVTLLTFVSLAVQQGVAFADRISSSALFLSPLAVPETTYDSSLNNYHLLTGLDGSSGLTQTYTSADMGGANIIGARILPLLNPNPSTSQGQYSDKDLAAINLSNYSTYFFAQPNQDYFANLSSGTLTVEYDAPGTYFVEVTAEQNGVTFSKVFEDAVDDYVGAIGATPDPTQPGRVIASPNAALNLVSNDGTAYNNAAFATLTSEGKNVQRTNSVQNAIAQIQAACRARGGPISVALVGHGVPGAISIGNTWITLNPRPNSNDLTPAQFQAAVDTMNDGSGRACVDAIDFYSCNTGRDGVNVNLTRNPNAMLGTQFLNAMQASIPNTRAFNQFTTAFAPVVVLTRQGWVTRPGYFDVGAGGVLGGMDLTDVPEPSSMPLVITGLLICVWKKLRLP
jgi:hypothetical protein